VSGESLSETGATTGVETQLAVVCGLPGAGKTTVAERAVELLDAELFRTDVVRKDIFTDPDYTTPEMRTVYDAMFDRATETLRDGESVVLDGTFKRRDLRERARHTASDLGVPFTLVKVDCEEGVVEQRIRERSDDASDADFEIHRQYREEFETVTGEHARIDNSGTLEETLAQVRDTF
jgi:predicted kinase